MWDERFFRSSLETIRSHPGRSLLMKQNWNAVVFTPRPQLFCCATPMSQQHHLHEWRTLCYWGKSWNMRQEAKFSLNWTSSLLQMQHKYMFSIALTEQTAAFMCIQKHGKIQTVSKGKELKKTTLTSLSVNLHKNSCKVDQSRGWNLSLARGVPLTNALLPIKRCHSLGTPSGLSKQPKAHDTFLC